MSLLPEDAQLPSGWVCKYAREGEIVFNHPEGGLEVEATRTDDLQLLPFDLTSGWELTCRMRSGESVSERTIGRVTTQSAAIDGLRSCMERISSLIRMAGSTTELTPVRIAKDIELRDEIPSAVSDRPTRDRDRRVSLRH